MYGNRICLVIPCTFQPDFSSSSRHITAHRADTISNPIYADPCFIRQIKRQIGNPAIIFGCSMPYDARIGRIYINSINGQLLSQHRYGLMNPKCLNTFQKLRFYRNRNLYADIQRSFYITCILINRHFDFQLLRQRIYMKLPIIHGILGIFPLQNRSDLCKPISFFRCQQFLAIASTCRYFLARFILEHRT